MSSLHLSHKILWEDLHESFKIYSDPGIILPSGDCNLIHLENKKIEHKLKNRNYLQNLVCDRENCETTQKKLFRKSNKHRFKLSFSLKFHKPKRFIKSYLEVIKEFAITERKKLVRKIKPIDRESLALDLVKTHEKLGDSYYRNTCDCLLFLALIEISDLDTLLSFDNEIIAAVLSCNHGHAVGKNIEFLLHNVLTVYFITNTIYSLNLLDKPDKWGPMVPNKYFRGLLMYDCDGISFLHLSRKYLTDDVYMKDLNLMKELCKNCFKFLYCVEMLFREINPDRNLIDMFHNYSILWYFEDIEFFKT